MHSVQKSLSHFHVSSSTITTFSLFLLITHPGSLVSPLSYCLVWGQASISPYLDSCWNASQNPVPFHPLFSIIAPMTFKIYRSTSHSNIEHPLLFPHLSENQEHLILGSSFLSFRCSAHWGDHTCCLSFAAATLTLCTWTFSPGQFSAIFSSPPVTHTCLSEARGICAILIKMCWTVF